jgi:hypothetical protein
VPDAERSQASGVVQTVRQVGGILGVAVIGGVVLALGPALPGRTGMAESVAAGFGAAAAAFALAILAGALLLGPTRSTSAATPWAEPDG